MASAATVVQKLKIPPLPSGLTLNTGPTDDFNEVEMTSILRKPSPPVQVPRQQQLKRLRPAVEDYYSDTELPFRSQSHSHGHVADRKMIPSRDRSRYATQPISTYYNRLNSPHAQTHLYIPKRRRYKRPVDVDSHDEMMTRDRTGDYRAELFFAQRRRLIKLQEHQRHLMHLSRPVSTGDIRHTEQAPSPVPSKRSDQHIRKHTQSGTVKTGVPLVEYVEEVTEEYVIVDDGLRPLRHQNSISATQQIQGYELTAPAAMQSQSPNQMRRGGIDSGLGTATPTTNGTDSRSRPNTLASGSQLNQQPRTQAQTQTLPGNAMNQARVGVYSQNNKAKKKPMPRLGETDQADSSAVLIPVTDRQNSFTAEEILGEDIFGGGSSGGGRDDGEDIIKKFARAARNDAKPFVEEQDGRDGGRQWTRLFRFLNFIRALGTTSYGIFLVTNYWNNPLYTSLNSKPYFYASLTFLCIDLLFTFIKAFPVILWCCWNVKDWERKKWHRSFSIWNLVADHELLLDVGPILANVILRVYGFRLGEVVSIVQATQNAAETGSVVNVAGVELKQRDMNLIMLAVFAFTLFSTMTLHTLRLTRLLISQKRAYMLSFMVVIKILLLMFDLLTNALLLYETLVFKLTGLFTMTLVVNLVLAVFAASPLIGLTTNVLVNIPLHLCHLRMQLHSRSLPTGEVGRDVAFGRVFKAALRKACHPLIMAFFGTYAAFSFFALAYILHEIYQLDYSTVQGLPSTVPMTLSSSNQEGGGFWVQWSNQESRQRILIVMLWFNLVVNYGAGVVSSAGFWVLQVMRMPWAVCKGMGCRASRR